MTQQLYEEVEAEPPSSEPPSCEEGQGDWNDWRWQLENRIHSLAELGQYLDLLPHERDAISNRDHTLPVSITPYYLSLIRPEDPEDPIRKTIIPTIHENDLSPGEETDPLNEDEDSPVPGLVHRYPDRVLFLVTNRCSVYCRYCTRSRAVGKAAHRHGRPCDWEQCLQYIESNTAIRDVLISGGDPLVLEDHLLAFLLDRLRRIPHVEIIRIGTKVPMVLPQRITPSLLDVLRAAHPLFINIHVTHPRELTPEATAACKKLADIGIPLGSQTVLLQGINDRVDTMKALFQGLLKIRVRPYYLYQCDRIPGSAHFATPIEAGLEIVEGLRGHTSGLAVPHYVVDAPGGGGKIPLLPEYCVDRTAGALVLRNYQQRMYAYPLLTEDREAPPTADAGRRRRA